VNDGSVTLRPLVRRVKLVGDVLEITLIFWPKDEFGR
jgi:hypothetical protein